MADSIRLKIPMWFTMIPVTVGLVGVYVVIQAAHMQQWNNVRVGTVMSLILLVGGPLATRTVWLDVTPQSLGFRTFWIHHTAPWSRIERVTLARALRWYLVVELDSGEYVKMPWPGSSSRNFEEAWSLITRYARAVRIDVPGAPGVSR